MEYTPMKKVQVWLTDDKHKALKEYCMKESRSMYSVLKEGVIHVLQGERAMSECSVISKSEATPFTPPLNSTENPSPHTISPKLGKLEERVSRVEKEIDNITGNELLWREVSELKAGLGELRGLFSAELEKKFDKKIEDVVVGVLEKLGILEEMV